MAEKLVLGPILAQIWAAKKIFFFKNLAPPVTRCYGELSSILRKLSGGRTDGRMDKRTQGESEFIGRCLTNVKHPKRIILNVRNLQ